MMLNRATSLNTNALAKSHFTRHSTDAEVALALTAGFLPAFRHDETGEVRLCQLADGRIACLHLLDSLPEAWVAERDHQGRPVALIDKVRAGYWRGSEFWTLSDLVHPHLDS